MKKSSWNDGHSSSVIDFVLQNVSKPDYILFAISEIRFHRKDWCSRNAWSLLREMVIALYSSKTFTQQHVGVRNADSYIEIKELTHLVTENIFCGQMIIFMRVLNKNNFTKFLHYCFEVK